MRDALDKIAKINQLLGGNRLTLLGVKKLLKNISKDTEITIVDIGCGNGDMLRTLANYGFKNNLKLKLIGIDANNFTINHAIETLTENTDFINDLKINSANLVDVILDIEEKFEIIIDNHHMEKMLDIKAAIEIIETQLSKK